MGRRAGALMAVQQALFNLANLDLVSRALCTRRRVDRAPRRAARQALAERARAAPRPAGRARDAHRRHRARRAALRALRRGLRRGGATARRRRGPPRGNPHEARRRRRQRGHHRHRVARPRARRACARSSAKAGSASTSRSRASSKGSLALFRGDESARPRSARRGASRAPPRAASASGPGARSRRARASRARKAPWRSHDATPTPRSRCSRRPRRSCRAICARCSGTIHDGARSAGAHRDDARALVASLVVVARAARPRRRRPHGATTAACRRSRLRERAAPGSPAWGHRSPPRIASRASSRSRATSRASTISIGCSSASPITRSACSAPSAGSSCSSTTRAAWSRTPRATARAKRRTQNFSRSVAERVIKEGEPVIATSARDDERLAQAVSVHQLMIQSIACVPIRGAPPAGKTIGALYVETRLRPGVRFREELPTLAAFADQAAIAIEGARLIDENRRRADELEIAERRAHRGEGQARRAPRAPHRAAPHRAPRSQASALRAALALRLRGPRRHERRDAQALRAHRSRHGHRRARSSSPARAAPARRSSRAPSTSPGPRAKQPFLGVNCGAIPANLLESELFGHVRGAFTGAERDRKGLFREAEDGTILLDEIGEMPQKMQAGLLRVLQEKTVRPVGGAKEEPCNARVIAATNRDLSQMVAEGTFREDLFYRLHVIELKVPRAARAHRGHPCAHRSLPHALLGALQARAQDHRAHRGPAAPGVRLAGQRAPARARAAQRVAPLRGERDHHRRSRSADRERPRRRLAAVVSSSRRPSGPPSRRAARERLVDEHRARTHAGGVSRRREGEDPRARSRAATGTACRRQR